MKKVVYYGRFSGFGHAMALLSQGRYTVYERYAGLWNLFPE
jgi:hypothetical protein